MFYPFAMKNTYTLLAVITLTFLCSFMAMAETETKAKSFEEMYTLGEKYKSGQGVSLDNIKCRWHTGLLAD